jgi:hypothetical protein
MKMFSMKEDNEAENSFKGNPFAHCVMHELDQRIIYQKVRLYLEKHDNKEITIDCYKGGVEDEPLKK